MQAHDQDQGEPQTGQEAEDLRNSEARHQRELEKRGRILWT